MGLGNKERGSTLVGRHSQSIRVQSNTRVAHRGTNFIAAAIQLGVVLLLLRTPADYRNVFLIAAAIVCFVVALSNFAAVWTFLLLVLPLIHLVSAMFGEPKVTLIRILLAGMTLVFLIQRKKPDFWKILIRPLGLSGFVLFVLANIVSAVHSAEPEAVLRSLTYLEPVLFCVLTYYVVSQDSANLRQVLRAIVIGGAFAAIIGLAELTLQRSGLEILGLTDLGFSFSVFQLDDRFGLGGRIISTIGQPIYAAMYFAIFLIVSVYCIVVYVPEHKGLFLILIPTGTLLILATGSRGPLLALVPTLLAFVALSSRKNKVLPTTIVGVLLLGLFAYVALPNLLSYVRETFALDPNRVETQNVIGRIELTKVLFDIFQRNLVFGYGPGLVQKYALMGMPEFAGLNGVENQYAMILADGGLLAGSTYLLFMSGAILMSLRIHSSGNREVGYGGLMILSLLVFYFVATVSVTSLTLISNYLLMAVYGAVVARSDNEKGQTAA